MCQTLSYNHHEGATNGTSGSLQESLCRRGISRRAFLKYCASLTSLLALPASSLPALAGALGRARRHSVIWLSFQACTGCTESLARAYSPSLESLIFDFISLDYHGTLQAAAGRAAEDARSAAMREFQGKYLLVADGSVPLHFGGACSTSAGLSDLDLLRDCAEGAAAILAVGTCAAFGGLPAANPNPTGAASVGTLMEQELIPRRPLVNLSGCPPVPAAMAAVFAHYVTFGEFPALDDLRRPLVFYANTIHDRCPRLHFFKQGKFARGFDDEGARKGWCLYELGCKGPVTRNACATLKWNEGTSFPVKSGHPCIGCSEPGFWDAGGFYRPGEAVMAAVEKEERDSRLDKGQALFDNNCIYCHSLDARPFRTETEKIPGLLRPGAVRAHRFEFSEQELRDLVDYLSARTKGG